MKSISSCSPKPEKGTGSCKNIYESVIIGFDITMGGSKFGGAPPPLKFGHSPRLLQFSKELLSRRRANLTFPRDACPLHVQVQATRKRKLIVGRGPSAVLNLLECLSEPTGHVLRRRA